MEDVFAAQNASTFFYVIHAKPSLQSIADDILRVCW